MNEQIFSDDIGAIAVSGPIVRFDLMIQSPTEKDAQGKPKLVVHQRVIMPIDAFLRAASKIQNSVQDMVKKGVITRAPKAAATAPKDAASQPKK
jgi:hypothetical protein